jgi:hypothetical protein
MLLECAPVNIFVNHVCMTYRLIGADNSCCAFGSALDLGRRFGQVGASSWGYQRLLHSHALKCEPKKQMQRRRMQCILNVPNGMASALVC